MARAEWQVVGYLVVALIGGAALASLGDTQAPWYISRVSGLAAFMTLSLSMVLGLLLSTRGSRAIPRIFSFELHQFLSVLSLALVGVHGGVLLFDGWFKFTPLHLVVPFIAPYAAFWTGLGVIGAWTMAAVTGSYWARRQMGHRAWRRLHYASFAAYLMALLHGVYAGTDTQLPVVLALYAVSAAAVAGLLALRLTASPRPAARGEGRARPAIATDAFAARRTR